MVRLIVDSGILPEGSLQLISGSARNLLDELDYRDLLSFTGSASTANLLKTHPNVVDRAACASPPKPTRSTPRSSAPTRSPGTPEFDAFIKSVVTEMTVKAGQKCTAIRRTIVPQRAGG